MDGRPLLASHFLSRRLQIFLRAAWFFPDKGRRGSHCAEVCPGMNGVFMLEHSQSMAAGDKMCRAVHWRGPLWHKVFPTLSSYEVTLTLSHWEMAIYVSSPWNWTGTWLANKMMETIQHDVQGHIIKWCCVYLVSWNHHTGAHVSSPAALKPPCWEKAHSHPWSKAPWGNPETTCRKRTQPASCCSSPAQSKSLNLVSI